MPGLALSRLRALWWRARESFWLVPTIALLVGVLLGMALVDLDARLELDLAGRWPRLFGAGAEGSRGTLEAIAGSMITVAGVVFSVTIVALSLTASTYAPRVLRTFMHDRPTQATFGVFVGVFAYCLVVLRTVRASGEDGAFVPSIAVLVALALALAAVWVLVYFIHHVAVSIQIPTILERIAAETRAAIDSLFPEALGEAEDDAQEELERFAGPWRAVPAQRTGYIVAVDNEALIDFARRRGVLLRMELAVGEFAIEAQPLASLAGGEPDADAEATELNELFAVEAERTIEQDAEFGVQQIVDVAARALSPGINNPSTAILCIDHLTALLVRFARRRLPRRVRSAEGKPRVLAKGATFESLTGLVFGPLIRYAAGKEEVLASLERAARIVAGAAPPGRRRAMRAHFEALERAASAQAPRP